MRHACGRKNGKHILSLLSFFSTLLPSLLIFDRSSFTCNTQTKAAERIDNNFHVHACCSSLRFRRKSFSRTPLLQLSDSWRLLLLPRQRHACPRKVWSCYSCLYPEVHRRKREEWSTIQRIFRIYLSEFIRCSSCFQNCEQASDAISSHDRKQ